MWPPPPFQQNSTLCASYNEAANGSFSLSANSEDECVAARIYFCLSSSPCKCMPAKNKEAVLKCSISFVNLTSVCCHSAFHRDAEATHQLSAAQCSAWLKGGASELLINQHGGMTDPRLSPSHRPSGTQPVMKSNVKQSSPQQCSF